MKRFISDNWHFEMKIYFEDRFLYSKENGQIPNIVYWVGFQSRLIPFLTIATVSHGFRPSQCCNPQHSTFDR